MPLTIEAGIKAWYPMSRAYKWEIKFDGWDTPFPASGVSDVWQQVMNGNVGYVPGGYAYPELATRGDMSVTAHEIKDHDLKTYFTEWREEISAEGRTIALLAEAAREVIISPLQLDNSVLQTITLIVIPDGQVTYEYSSDKNSGLTAMMAFKVVGE